MRHQDVPYSIVPLVRDGPWFVIWEKQKKALSESAYLGSF